MTRKKIILMYRSQVLGFFVFFSEQITVGAGMLKINGKHEKYNSHNNKIFFQAVNFMMHW